MADEHRRACSHCRKVVGEEHPTTGRPLTNLIENDEKDTYICFDCVAMCVSVMASNAQSQHPFRFATIGFFI
jgi:hypothetical protein